MSIGIGYVTYNREDNWKYLKLDKSWASSFVIVNDGTPYKEGTYPDFPHIIQHTHNKSVGVSKNDAIRYLMNNNTEHLFIIEDDIIVEDPSCFDAYIKLAEKSGIKHLNFAYHGHANLEHGKPNPRFCVEYDDVNKMSINFHCVGAFTYYHRSIIEKCGYIDEFYINAWEHISHTYEVIKRKLHPPFWNFSDVMDSNRFFREIGTVEANSVIRRDKKHMNENIKLGRDYFKALNGFEFLEIPDTPKEEVFEYLEKMEKKEI
jgi:hypothetical protein